MRRSPGIPKSTADTGKKLENGELTKPEVLVGRFREFFETEGLDVTAAPAFNERYQVCLGDTIVFRDDSYEIVKSLRGRVKQYVVSNGTVLAQTKKLRLSGLGELMDGIFLSEELGAEKPNAAFFDQVFEAIEETDRKKILIVGGFFDERYSRRQPCANCDVLV